MQAKCKLNVCDRQLVCVRINMIVLPYSIVVGSCLVDSLGEPPHSKGKGKGKTDILGHVGAIFGPSCDIFEPS